MNIQRKNSAHHFRMQSEREQTLVTTDDDFRVSDNESSEKTGEGIYAERSFSSVDIESFQEWT